MVVGHTHGHTDFQGERTLLPVIERVVPQSVPTGIRCFVGSDPGRQDKPGSGGGMNPPAPERLAPQKAHVRVSRASWQCVAWLLWIRRVGERSFRRLPGTGCRVKDCGTGERTACRFYSLRLSDVCCGRRASPG